MENANFTETTKAALSLVSKLVTQPNRTMMGGVLDWEGWNDYLHKDMFLESPERPSQASGPLWVAYIYDPHKQRVCHSPNPFLLLHDVHALSEFVDECGTLRNPFIPMGGRGAHLRWQRRLRLYPLGAFYHATLMQKAALLFVFVGSPLVFLYWLCLLCLRWVALGDC